MGLFSFLFGGGGGGSSSTTTVSTSTNVTVSPNITNVVDLSPVQKMIDALTVNNARSDQALVVASVAPLAAARANSEALARVGLSLDGLGKALLFGTAGLALALAVRR